jgi:flagellar biosynthesis GTPase FlhF
MNISKSGRWSRTALLLFIFSAAGVVYAQDNASLPVDQGELEQNLAPVTFYNYEGPHARIETREQIRQIGVGLGRAVRGGAARSGADSRYFVIHSVTAPEGTKLDADIFGLGVDTGVDHIRNLRTIIQGYLQEAYGYTERDAALLAEYVTIYNAVYRGDWDYFSGRYKAPVIANLTEERAGLSIRYDEWPGRTLMLIPLGIGGLSSIDTTTIADDRVVEELRKEDDLGLEQRRDMVDLKEREAAEAEQRATSEREAVRQEERRITDERAQLEQERENIAKEREEAADAGREEELAQREREADQKAEALDQEEAALEPRREEAQRQEDFAERKTEEAQQERESIAQDQQTVIDDGGRQTGVIGAMLESASATLGRLVRLDPANGQILRRSPLNTVSIRTLSIAGGKILAIAGENTGAGAVRLVEINPGSLEMTKQGEDDIHPGSLLWVNGGDLYAITVNPDKSLNLGRFDTNLGLQTRSAITVHPNASVTIQQGNLLTQRGDGSAVLLNPASLTEVGK